MAAHVLRLRLDLLLGALRGRLRQVVRTVVVFALLAAAVVAVCTGILHLRTLPGDAAHAIVVLCGAALTLACAGIPLVSGAEDPLDPRRFAVFGLSAGPLTGTLLAASLVSVPTLALLGVAGCLVALWTAHGAVPAAAVAGAVLGVATCLLLVRSAMAIAALVLRERRSRELTGVLLVSVLVVVVPATVFLVSLDWRDGVPSQLHQAVAVLALTPLGAAWALPAGAHGIAVPLVAVATVLVLGALWALLVRLLLTTSERPTSGKERRRLGWFNVMPGTAGGAIAARSLLYWFHDPRYLVNVLIVPVAAVITIVPLLVVGVPLETVVLIPAPLMAVFFGWLVHNDLAYDSTGIWMHVAAGVRGFADRLGRLVPVLLIAVPLLAVAIPVTIWLHGRWAMLPALVGVCAALFLCGLGLSSMSSVIAPYPVSRPGDGPFQQPQRTRGSLAQGVVLFGAVALSAPALWWGWLALTVDTSHAWEAFWFGIGAGGATVVLGVVIGGVVFGRRGSRIMEFAEST